MDWIFWLFLIAAILHVTEEYKYPGGFPDAIKRMNPGVAPFVTVKFAVIINGLFLLLCAAGAIVASRNLVFSLSVASLLFTNALIHLAGTFRARRYMPGVISGVLLYLPLSLYAYYAFASSGQVTLGEGVASGVLGALYNAVPVGYLAVASMLTHV